MQIVKFFYSVISISFLLASPFQHCNHIIRFVNNLNNCIQFMRTPRFAKFPYFSDIVNYKLRDNFIAVCHVIFFSRFSQFLYFVDMNLILISYNRTLIFLQLIFFVFINCFEFLKTEERMHP